MRTEPDTQLATLREDVQQSMLDIRECQREVARLMLEEDDARKARNRLQIEGDQARVARDRLQQELHDLAIANEAARGQIWGPTELAARRFLTSTVPPALATVDQKCWFNAIITIA
ncbi:hypothetical protein LTR78_009956 [Recurvomyces mirabilis]|uniref:Uncharacterized protein n=1 Tax=Recurvomyces mirabilis TaxID=574656 RepID=A0AAE0TMF0_9PEZI|nr:hypothetical protein LTR78_009956 [Recurvomyces mirabilis]KAK5160388.1 hypothetical protein LTS14_001400 [Recurvomyces mirabilis]